MGKGKTCGECKHFEHGCLSSDFVKEEDTLLCEYFHYTPYNYKFVKKATAWIQSEEGQKALDESLKKSEIRRKAFNDSCRVDPDILTKRVW